MKSPCYNEEKKLDCPRRHSGCAVDCPEWAEYVKARDAEYIKRRADYGVVDVLAAGKARRNNFYIQKAICDRNRRRGH